MKTIKWIYYYPRQLNLVPFFSGVDIHQIQPLNVRFTTAGSQVKKIVFIQEWLEKMKSPETRTSTFCFPEMKANFHFECKNLPGFTDKDFFYYHIGKNEKVDVIFHKCRFKKFSFLSSAWKATLVHFTLLPLYTHFSILFWGMRLWRDFGEENGFRVYFWLIRRNGSRYYLLTFCLVPSDSEDTIECLTLAR